MRWRLPERVTGALAGGGASLREHRFWLECAALTLLAVAAAVSLGRASLAREAALRAEAERLERAAEAIDAWARNLRPAAPAESTAWRASQGRVGALSDPAPHPLALANRLTRRAEEVGVSDLRIRLTSGDSVEAPPPRRVGPWTVGTGEPPVAVEFDGRWAEVLAFLASLPADIEVVSVQVAAGEEGTLRARATLLPRAAMEQGR